MLCKRIIPCLDVANNRTVKGVKFSNIRDVGDPVELAILYQDQGADELIFLDISASHEGRGTEYQWVSAVAKELMIPFTVGGGISSLEQVDKLLQFGADKIAINTSAVKNPKLIEDIAKQHGSQCCVLAIDARRCSEGWKVLTHGGRVATDKEALTWAQEAIALGAGEILLTSWDQDGTKMGFDIELTRLFSTTLPVPIIASGGASGPESFVDVFQHGYADAGLAATIFHDGIWTIGKLKEELIKERIAIRQC